MEGPWWWPRYHGMAPFAPIFAFLVFLLWCWPTMMHGTNMMPHASCVSLHDHSHLMLDFLLSLYCSQHLYLVTSRRWTSDQQLSQSLGWPRQCSLHPPQHMSQSFSLSKVSLVQCPLSFFLVPYIVFCHMFPNSFLNVSQYIWCSLGSWLVIGLIVLPSIQVRWLVVLKL